MQATSMIVCRDDLVNDKIAATGIAVGLAHRWCVATMCGQARVMTDLLQRIQDRLVGTLCASCRCGCYRRACR